MKPPFDAEAPDEPWRTEVRLAVARVADDPAGSLHAAHTALRAAALHPGTEEHLAAHLALGVALRASGNEEGAAVALRAAVALMGAHPRGPAWEVWERSVAGPAPSSVDIG